MDEAEDAAVPLDTAKGKRDGDEARQMRHEGGREVLDEHVSEADETDLDPTLDVEERSAEGRS